MSNKKLFLIMLITLILITIGGVWASEDAVADNLASSDAAELSVSDSVDIKTDTYQTNVNTTSQTTDDSAEADDSSKNTNGELLGATRDEDILGASANLRTLMSDIGSSTVYLNSNYTKDSGDYGTRTGQVPVTGIVISSSKTIYGNNNYIDAGNGGRIFEISSGTHDVTFKNIRFIGGSSELGGAILINTNCYNIQFINCTFQNNQATVAGAVHIGRTSTSQDRYSHHISFINCTFDRNKATGTSTGMFNCGGGAIHADYTYGLVFNNTVFNNNDGGIFGGVGFFEFLDYNNDELIFYKCNFTNNTAKGGGVIRFSHTPCPLKISHCIFENNSATYTSGTVGGGDIQVPSGEGITHTIINSSFINSKSGVMGGSLHFKVSNLKLYNCSFFNTQSNTNGASIYFEGTYAQESLIIEGCNFTKTSNAHAIYVNDKSKVDIKKSNFINNTAADNPAIYFANTMTSISIAGTNFIGNKVTGNGGALSLSQANYNLLSSLDGCTFINNSADGNGGAIYVPAGTNGLVFNHCKFIGNNATSGNGGSIYFYNNGQGIQFLNSEFDSNNAKSGGAIIFYSSSATNTYSRITIDNCNFTRNKATFNDTYGGSAVTFNRATNVKIFNSEFEDNVVEANGALLFQTCGDVYVKNCNFTGNNATSRSAGAIYFFSSSQNMTIEKSKFINNAANGIKSNDNAIGCGGAVYLEGNNHRLIDNEFINNRANHANGGAVFSKSNGITIIGNTFTDNYAYSYGGAFIDDHGSGNLRIIDSVFNNNNAWKGGAVDLYIFTSNTVIEGTSFNNNSANESSGAVYIESDGGSVSISECNFTNNSAPQAGAIEVHLSGVTISQSKFVANKATDTDGGAVYFASAGGTISDCEFTNNYAKGDGGAVYFASSSGFIKNSNFIGNNATNGGAVYVVASSTLNISDSTFRQNVADVSGGAVYYGGSSTFGLKIYNDTFIENTALNGGAVDYLAGATIPYRDFNWFEGEATSLGNNRYSWIHPGVGQIIYSSYFDGNEDYLMNMTAAQSKGTYTVLITITTSKRMSQSARVNVTLVYANGTAIEGYTNKVLTIQTDSAHWIAGDEYVQIILPLDEQLPASYNLTVGISDSLHQYKAQKFNYTVERLEKGGFELIQEAIDEATKNWQEGDPIPVVNLTNERYAYNPQYDEGPIVVNSPVIIVGVNNTIITALGYSRIFEINSPDVTFVNLTFTRGNANGNESSDDTLHGGAILWNGINGNIVNCTFDNNTAAYGGAVYWNATDGNVISSEFKNNNASEGGALFVNENTDKFTVSDTEFTTNTAVSDGGAVYLNGDGSEITGSQFYNNTAEDDGGAVFVMGSDNVIVGSEFSDNEADDGGAVYVGGDASIGNSNFTSNEAINGAAIYLNSVSQDTVISNDTFNQNTVTGNGGAVYIRDSEVSVENSTFAHNGAGVHGADICVDDNSEVLLYNLNITNTLSGDASIYVNSNVTVEKTEINSDNAIIFNNGDSIVIDTVINGDNAIVFNNGDSIVIDTVINGDNAILINPNGNVGLDGVNTTGSGDYAVSNYGTLYLDGNNFTDIILNNGNITSRTNTTVLGGETFEILIGDSIALNASIVDDNGNIIIIPGLTFVDNATFTQPADNDGKTYNSSYTDAKQGVYVLSVNNTGLQDNNIENAILKVKDPNTSLSVTTEQKNQGELVIIKAEIIVGAGTMGPTGNVTFEINGLQYSVSKEETEMVNETTYVATLTLPNLIPDTYTVTATYNGDDTHLGCVSAPKYFFVNPRDSNITVSVDNVAEGQNATATIKTNATNGTIRITVTGKDPVEIVMDGDTYVYDLGALEPGNYTVRVDYVANQFYKASTDSTSFEVYEYDMIVEVSETKYNQTAVINITLPADANGPIEVFLNGENLTGRINPLGNGVYQVETDILTVLGEYEVNVTYTNGTDGKYYSRNASETFTVDKNDVYEFELEIAPDDITFGDEVNITVTGPAGFEGKLTIDDEEIPFTIGDDGTFTVTRSNFTAGSHTVTANITSDENYTSKEITKIITVESATPLMTITVPESVEPNSEANVTVTVGENANGTVYISVDGVTTPVEVKDGVATLPLDTTKPGNYTVTAEFISADANYKSASNTTGADYTVERYNSTITSNVTIAPNNNVTVTVTVDGAGDDSNVTLTLSNGVTKTVNVVDGVATFDLGVFDEQKLYNYTAVFNGDKNLNPNSTTGNFTVGGLNNYTVNVTISDTQYGDNTTIKVTIDEPAMGGTVTVYVDETPYTAKLVDGAYVVVTPALAVGNYTVNVTYTGNSRYAGKNNTDNILTVKTNSSYTFNVDVIPAPFGEDTIINITGPAGENVTVIIDGVEETVTLDENGTAIIKRDNLTAGPHTVVVNITGNENYTSKEISQTVNVPAATPELSIDITQPIAPNAPANITVFVGKNATGTVSIYIDNKLYANVEVDEEGNAVVPIEDTSVPGTYNVTAIYISGDNDNYKAASNSTGETFTIDRYDSVLDYSVDVADNNAVTVTVQLNSTATGTVTVKVGEETFNATVGDGGVAVVDLRVFDKSESPVNYEIIYSGDDVFNPKSQIASEAIDIGKLNNATVEVEIIEGEFGDNTTIKVTVPKDGDGNVTIFVDGVPTVVVPDENGVAVLNVTGTVGPHTVNVTYTNSTKYNDKDWNGSFDVSRDSDYEFSVVVTPENVKFGENVTVTVTAPEGVHEVNVTIDGVTIPVSIGSDGKGNYTLNNLTAGPHTVDVDFNGNENYTEAHNSTSFTIDPAVPKMDIIVSEHIAPTSDANVTVVVGDNATGTVIIYIDGVANPVKVENGTAVLPLKTDVPGTYNITAEFISGDANYESPVTSGTVNYTIDRYDSVLDYSVDVADNNAVTVTVQLNSTATGTVTVKVGEETFNATVGDGGVAVVDLRVFDKSESPVNYEIIYSGDDVFNPKSQIASEPIEIGKLNNAAVEVEIIEGEFGDNTTIKVTVPKDGDGNVTIFVDGVPTVVVPDENGVAVLNVTGTVGPHTVNVTYTNSTKYNDKDWNGSFDVSRDSDYEFSVVVTPEDVKFSENVTITVTAPEGVHEVNVTIDGVTVPVLIGSDGKGNYTLNNLTAGPHTVDVDFAGNENYTAAHNSTSFTIDPAVPKMDIIVSGHIAPTSEANVTVVVGDNATGTVIIYVDGVANPVKVENGTAVLPLKTDVPGTYNITAEFISGDANYESPVTSGTVNYTIDRYDSELSYTVNVSDNNAVTVTVQLNSTATGTVTVKVGEETFNATVGDGGVAVVDLRVFDKSESPVNYEIIYSGDSVFNPKSESASEAIGIGKLNNATVEVEIIEGEFGDNTTIKVTVPKDGDGNVTIFVDGVPTVVVPDENGVAVLNVTGTVGPHTVNVTYTNSTKYNDKDWNGSFDVSRDSDYEFGVVVTPEDVKFGENVTVTVTAPEGVHEVNVTIDGETVTIPIGSDGKGNYTLNNLTAGPHTVDVDFAGNENYTEAHNSTSFAIGPAVPKMDIVVSGHIAPTSEANVTVVVGDNATGTVIIYIDGVANPVKVENGTAVLPLKTDVPGTYNITAEFISGDANYESPVTSDKVNYTIDRYDSELSYTVNVSDNNAVTVTVQLNSTATGTVTVKVGEETFNATVGDGGVAVVDLRVFDKSESPVNYEIIYSGDDVFNPKSEIASEPVEIGKLNNATVEVEIIEGEFGDNTTIKVTVPKDGDGNVTIFVDGVPTVVVPDENGVAVLNVTGTVGPHRVNVTYTNSTKYNDKDWNGSFEVPKDSHYDFNITVEPSEIKYGDNVTITVSAPEGVHEVNVTIDGETVTIPIGSDGKGNHTVTNFTAGPHTVEIDFNGNENYTEAHNSTTFTVETTQPDTFKVDISEPNNVGDTVNVTVTLPEDATGTITVKVNGTEYSGKVENGTVTVIIPKLGNGTYPVNVTYSGDSNYDAIYNDTESVVVDKNVPEISAVTSPIKRGDAAIVNVTIPGDATGTVTVEVGGVTKTVAVTGGVNSISVEGISVGENQTVKVTYNGDDKYTPNTYETALTVLPKDTGADDFKVDDKGNGTIIVTVPEGATGKVNLTIGNETYEANITDGKAIFDIANKTDQTPGVHDITLTYSGDENNTAVEFNSSANVPKWDSQVNVNVPTIRQGDVAKVNVTVTSPEGRGYTPNGTVRVKVDGKEGYFGTLDENGQAIIDVPGLAEGPHTIDVVYDGNDYYLNATGSGNVEVQAPIVYNVNGTGNDSEVDVKVPGNGTVEIFIDNEPRDVSTDENGNAKANLTGLLPGQHNITIKYTDENNVVSYVNSTVVVPRWTSKVEASAATIRQGDSALIKVKVDSDETGTVYIDIDGTGYYGLLENGTVTINASGIKKGTYAGNVTYLGDGKYDPSNNTFTLVVESEITIDIDGAGDNSKVVVKLPENGTDNVTVSVDGDEYPVTIVNGTAVADLSGLPAGEYNVTVIYTDKDGTQSVATKTVKVYDSINVADEIKRGWNSPFDAEAEFLDSEGRVLQNATVQFTINGKTYDVVTDEKGIGKLTTSHLAVGTYDATIKNTVTGETLTRKVTIVKRIIENKDVTTDYLEGKYYSVKVIGDDGEPVKANEVVGLSVNGVGYVVKTDKNGVAKLKINLIPKKYTIKAEYAKYQVTNKITVKQTMKLVKKTVTVKKGKKITLKATLKWTSGKAIKGKVIKFKFKGKTYKAKTNSKGVAKVVIKKKSVLKKLKKGKKYTYTATYVKNKLKGKVKIK